MENFIGCLAAFVFGLLLSNIESIGSREAKILPILGWLITLCFAKGEIQ